MLSVASHGITEDDDGTPVCPGCLRCLPVLAHFCPSCATPVTSYASTAPLESIWSLGTVINRLLSRRPNRLALVGTSLIALPAALTLVGFGLDLYGRHGVGALSSPMAFTRAAGWMPALLPSLLYVLLFVRVVRRWGRPVLCCADCGYDLTGNQSGVCPECGGGSTATRRR